MPHFIVTASLSLLRFARFICLAAIRCGEILRVARLVLRALDAHELLCSAHPMIFLSLDVVEAFFPLRICIVQSIAN